MTPEMNYHIVVSLPTNRNHLGSLKVFNKQGYMVMQPVPVLGRGSNLTTNNFNHNNRLMQNADIPWGSSRTRIIERGAPAETYGVGKRVHLYKAIDGEMLEAEKKGRSEILIHGGKITPKRGTPWYPLRPTYGCLRLSEENMSHLITVLTHLGSEGKITVTEQK